MIGLFYGTRPEYIKLKPILKALKDRDMHFLLFQIGQHSDLIKDCPYDIFLGIDSGKTHNRLNDIVRAIMYSSFKDLDYVLVVGDTTTAMAVALSAFHQEIPIMHVEAGMRTYDNKNPFPEERNRRIISALASVHYCPTENEHDNLVFEVTQGDLVITGNTVIDNLQGMKSSESNKVLVTLHRRENHEDMNDWFRAISNIAFAYPEYEFIFPMHPNPAVQKYKDLLNNQGVKIIDPLPYDEMKELIASCAAIITDSGGIQEEASFFKKPCYVCRKVTERECESTLLCPTPEHLENRFRVNTLFLVEEETPFGDGKAGERIAEDILRRVR